MWTLEVLTRHYSKRPSLLAIQQASLACQTSVAWQQTLLIDDIGRGVPWANAQLAHHEPTGDYIWILDDDDECICNTWVADLHLITEAHDPDIVWVKNIVHGHGELPEPDYWQARPAFGHIAMSCFAVRWDVYLHHREAFDAPAGADYRFAERVYNQTPAAKQYWHDCAVMRTQKVSRGAAE